MCVCLTVLTVRFFSVCVSDCVLTVKIFFSVCVSVCELLYTSVCVSDCALYSLMVDNDILTKQGLS